jgi:flagellar hook-length control protein FliK
VRFVQRVARAFQAIAGREGNVRLRLHPPELGSLRLELAVRGGVMTARLEAENTAARNLLLDNLPALRDRLAEQDIRIERFDVDLAGRSPNGTPREPGDRPQYHNGSEHNNGPSKQRGQAGESEATHAGRSQTPRHAGNLDVTI